MLNIYKGAPVQKLIHLLLVVTLSEFLTGFFHPHSLSSDFRKPTSSSHFLYLPQSFSQFQTCLSPQLALCLLWLFYVADRAHVSDSPDMMGASDCLREPCERRTFFRVAKIYVKVRFAAGPETTYDCMDRRGLWLNITAPVHSLNSAVPHSPRMIHR